MRLIGAASTALRSVLAGPARPARLLGAMPKAVYLAVEGPPGVLAVLTHDALRLPCGVVLPSTSAELPLTSLRSQWTVGAGRVGPVSIAAEWAPPVVRPGRPLAELVAGARAALGPAMPPVLGLGPGLTPSGDDVLAGFLVGARAFGLDIADLSRIVDLAPARTTALSAALLWHAARGECIREVAAFAAALCGREPIGWAARQLCAVGHTSGEALSHGLVAAAEQALGHPGSVMAAFRGDFSRGGDFASAGGGEISALGEVARERLHDHAAFGRWLAPTGQPGLHARSGPGQPRRISMVPTWRAVRQRQEVQSSQP